MPSAQLACEMGVSRLTVLSIRGALQANAYAMQPNFPLSDQQTETDELFQNAGEKCPLMSGKGIRGCPGVMLRLPR